MQPYVLNKGDKIKKTAPRGGSSFRTNAFARSGTDLSQADATGIYYYEKHIIITTK